MPLIQATLPGGYTPIPEKPVKDCPECGRKTKVRKLSNPDAYFCTDCDLEFGHRKRKMPGRPTKKYTITLKVDMEQIDKIIELWQAGVQLADIADAVGLDWNDAAIILIDLLRREKINERPGGAYGNVGV